VEATPDWLPYKTTVLSNLSHGHLLRFIWKGEQGGISKAVSMGDYALKLSSVPGMQHQRYISPNDLADLLRYRFDTFDHLDDLDKALSLHHETLTLLPEDHQHKAMVLSHLGMTLQCRFERLGQVTDIYLAISSHEEALGLTSDAHPHKFIALDSMSCALRQRFGYLSELPILKRQSIFTKKLWS
jgi:hypothetical protein